MNTAMQRHFDDNVNVVEIIKAGHYQLRSREHQELLTPLNWKPYVTAGSHIELRVIKLLVSQVGISQVGDGREEIDQSEGESEVEKLRKLSTPHQMHTTHDKPQP